MTTRVQKKFKTHRKAKTWYDDYIFFFTTWQNNVELLLRSDKRTNRKSFYKKTMKNVSINLRTLLRVLLKQCSNQSNSHISTLVYCSLAFLFFKTNFCQEDVPLIIPIILSQEDSTIYYFSAHKSSDNIIKNKITAQDLHMLPPRLPTTFNNKTTHSPLFPCKITICLFVRSLQPVENLQMFFW